MLIRFSSHAKRRMRERKIGKLLVKSIVDKPEFEFFDIVTNHTVLLSRHVFSGRERFIAVSIDKDEESITVVTVHPVRERDFLSRQKTGRWI